MARVELENDSSQEPAPECSTVCSPTDDDSSQQHFLIPGYNLIFIKEEEYVEQDAEGCSVNSEPEIRSSNYSTSETVNATEVGGLNAHSISPVEKSTEPSVADRKIKLYSCSDCSYESTRFSHLKRHIRKHTGEKPFSCELCDFKCSNSSSLKEHIRAYTGETPFRCEFCDYECARSSDLKKHIRTHTGEKPFSCKYCDYKCARSNYLKIHIRTHTGETPFSCEFCDFKCSQSDTLKSHIRTHTGETPFTCEFCDYKCLRSGDLKKHIRTHTGEKPFSCKLCDYKCAQSSTLKEHIRSHTGETPFSCEWGEVLADQKKFKDLFRGYDLALQVYPDNRFVINHLGEFHYRAGDFAKAHFYFKKACSMSPTECVESERNLEMCKSAMVDRWHFRMLNDSHRNEAYREAITKKIKQGFCRVLDIGTGSGLLSLIASELCYETSGAGPVFACEENFTMIKIAKNIQRRNLFVTMKLFHSHSRKLFLEHLHDKRVSLVVTEIMDAGLFGEGVLQTLNDAWRRFLLPPLPTQECSSCCDEEKPGVCMICNDQKLSPELRLSPRMNGMVVPLGATVWLAAIESVHVARQHRSLSSILRHNIETPFLFVNNSHEPYDSENLQSFPDAFKLLCEPIKCFFVNFNDPDQLLSFYNGQFDHHLHKIQFTTEGSLDAFVVWFDLHVDEDIKISTSPFDENAATCCWDQAIFPVHSELRVVAGSSAQLKVQTIKGILIVKLWEIENHIPSKSNYEEIPVSQEFIKFFNNSEYLDHLAIYSRTMACPGATILDLCPFPLVGLMRLKEDEDSSLYFIAKCKDDKLAVERIVEVNDIDPSRIVFGEECDVNDDDFMMRSKYDVVVTNLISQEGEMSPSSIYHLSSCKNFLSDYGRIIPQGVTVWGQLISSKALTRSTEVIEQGIVEKYHIPKYMNEFKVQHVIDINSQILSHTALSEPFQIGHIDTFDIALQKRLQFKKSVVANKEGTASALLQWFQYEIDLPGCGPLKYSTRSIGSHVNQMCVLMEKQQLKPKQVVKVNCEYYHGGLIIKFESQ